MKKHIIFSCLFLFSLISYGQKDQVNIVYVTQQRINSEEEHERQKKMKEKSVTTTSLETVNRDQWEKYKKKYEELRGRLKGLEFALTTIPSAWQIYLYGDKIKDNVSTSIEVIRREPLVAVMNIQAVSSLLQELELNTTLLVGSVASGSAIFQMEIADRKLLISYIVEEFKILQIQSSAVKHSLLRAEHELNWKKRMRAQLINRDKERFERFFRNVGLRN